MYSPIAVKFVLNTRHKTRNLYSAVADSGIKIVYICKMLPFRNAGNKFNIFLTILKANKVSPKLTLNLSLTLNNIFVTLFLFKPRANFTSCLACCNNFSTAGEGASPPPLHAVRDSSSASTAASQSVFLMKQPPQSASVSMNSPRTVFQYQT